MSATPQDVQALIDSAVTALKKTTSGYATKGKTPGVNWTTALADLASAREETGQLVAPPPPPPPTVACYWGARIAGDIYQQHYGAPNANMAPWCAADTAPNNWDRFEQHAGKKVCSVQWGGNSSQGVTFPFDKYANGDAHGRGAFSQYDLGPTKQQLLDLAAGSDATGTLTAAANLATAMAAQGYPIMFRPMWEMNGNWGYAWQSASIPASTYVAAWKALHAIFAAHAPNVSFFWCPNTILTADFTPWFPGVEYVDWVGVDAYNQGGTESPAYLLGTSVAKLESLAPGLPVGIGECGCRAQTSYHGGKTQWINDFFSYLPTVPVKWFNWFNDGGSQNLYIEASIDNGALVWSGEGQAAFAAGIADARYLSSPAAGFAAGQKVPAPSS